MSGSLASGRAASIARRLALSGGKAALPAPAERVRTGFRDADLPAAVNGAAAAATPTRETAPAMAPSPKTEPVMRAPSVQAEPMINAPASAAGRMLAMQRRRLVSAGKQALQAILKPAEPAPTAPAPAGARGSIVGQAMEAAGSARQAARARRTTLALFGRTALSTLEATPPSRPMREVKDVSALRAALAQPATATTRVTHSRNGAGDNVTGVERGRTMPISGIKKLAPGTTTRGLAPKVGLARTEAGVVVSGTLVRSTVAITGDEAGRNRVTGKVDQAPADDITTRPAQVAAQQFPAATPAVMGAARGISRNGSRYRERAALIETTEKGKPVTGSAVGISQRVTGDESGACLGVTGTQYLTPAARQTACGGAGGGTAPAAQLGASRADPVTRNKVNVAETIAGQRVTGPDFQVVSQVTGGEEGRAALVTGTPYQSLPDATDGLDAMALERMAKRLRRGTASKPVTGNIEAAANAVTGTARGAGRDITGTPYGGAALPPPPATNPLVAIDAGFSVTTPQRAAQLAALGKDQRVTGSFAIGCGKVTGNVEFQGRSRLREAGETLGHDRISGEGASGGRTVTGGAWDNQGNVTGTDAAFAAERNPSERGPKARAFAGTTAFKSKAVHEDAKQLVTGMAGFFSKSGAKVTLSGGAQS